MIYIAILKVLSIIAALMFISLLASLSMYFNRKK